MTIKIKNHADNEEQNFEEIDQAIKQLKLELRWLKSLYESEEIAKELELKITIKIK